MGFYLATPSSLCVEKMDWLLAEDSNAGYHNLTDEEIVPLVLEEHKDDDEEESPPAV